MWRQECNKVWCCLYQRGLPESDLVTFEWSHLSRNTVIHQLHIQISLCLCVADYLTEVIASHSEGIAIAITELGATYLSVCHTLIVQMGNLKGKEGHSLSQFQRIAEIQIKPLPQFWIY